MKAPISKHIQRSVSVIIPTYNRDALIGEAIDSVLAQDIENCDIETIVVDDGSTDNTSKLVRRYKDDVRYIKQTNKGAGAARNRGIEEAKGEWIAFLDSDDRWLPYKLSLQFKVLEAFPEYKAVHSNFRIFDSPGVLEERGLDYWVKSITGTKKVNWLEAYSKKYTSSDFHIYGDGISFDIFTGNVFAAFLRAPCAACWTLLLQKKCLDSDIRFAEGYSTWEDYWFFCRLSEKHDLIFMDIPTAENRGHSGPRLTQARRTKTLDYYLDICNRIYVPSRSANRPSDQTIKKHTRLAQIALFKEYLKEGMCSEARETFRSMEGVPRLKDDTLFWFYWIASFIPFDVVRSLVRLKRRILHDPD